MAVHEAGPCTRWDGLLRVNLGFDFDATDARLVPVHS